VHERRSPGQGQARSKDDAFELELLAAVGLIPPAVLDIAPVMVPVTAVCWVLLMVGAMITHGRPGQFKFVMLNSVLPPACSLQRVGRFGPAPFSR
jgi:predicted metal-binding membrane protein